MIFEINLKQLGNSNGSKICQNLHSVHNSWNLILYSVNFNSLILVLQNNFSHFTPIE